MEGPIHTADPSQLNTNQFLTFTSTPDGNGIIAAISRYVNSSGTIFTRTDPNFRELVYEL